MQNGNGDLLYRRKSVAKCKQGSKDRYVKLE